MNSKLTTNSQLSTTETKKYKNKLNKQLEPEQNHRNSDHMALAGVAQWIELQPVNQRVTGSIPSQGTCLGCVPGPQ